MAFSRRFSSRRDGSCLGNIISPGLHWLRLGPALLEIGDINTLSSEADN